MGRLAELAAEGLARLVGEQAVGGLLDGDGRRHGVDGEVALGRLRAVAGVVLHFGGESVVAFGQGLERAAGEGPGGGRFAVARAAHRQRGVVGAQGEGGGVGADAVVGQFQLQGGAVVGEQRPVGGGGEGDGGRQQVAVGGEGEEARGAAPAGQFEGGVQGAVGEDLDQLAGAGHPDAAVGGVGGQGEEGAAAAEGA
ncbi:hypothetical protein [Endothiovibrio diazotrophicus]